MRSLETREGCNAYAVALAWRVGSIKHYTSLLLLQHCRMPWGRSGSNQPHATRGGQEGGSDYSFTINLLIFAAFNVDVLFVICVSAVPVVASVAPAAGPARAQHGQSDGGSGHAPGTNRPPDARTRNVKPY